MQQTLDKLSNATAIVSSNHVHSGACEASVLIEFSDGTQLRADYWRLIKDQKHFLSSFDHQQRYALPEAIDAVSELQQTLHDLRVIDARLDAETGDLIFRFSPHCTLQILNFTGYEVWEIHFQDGSGELSNYCR